MKSTIYKILTKKHGLKVSKEASDFLCSVFESEDDMVQTLDFIAQQYVAQESIIYLK